MKLGHRCRQLIRSFGRVRIVSGRNSGLEKKRGTGAHLVVIRKNLRTPAVKQFESALRFRVLCRQPVPVEIKPVVIGPSAGPGFVMLPVGRIAHGDSPSVAIGPVREAIPSVGIEHRIENDHSFLQSIIHGRTAAGRKMIEIQDCGLRSACFISVNAVTLIEHDRHGRKLFVRNIPRGIRQS